MYYAFQIMSASVVLYCHGSQYSNSNYSQMNIRISTLFGRIRIWTEYRYMVYSSRTFFLTNQCVTVIETYIKFTHLAWQIGICSVCCASYNITVPVITIDLNVNWWKFFSWSVYEMFCVIWMYIPVFAASA